MDFTTNYSFKKPGLTDAANIEVLNDNFDDIDAEIKSLDNLVTSAVGSPLVATTVAGMTDTTKVYVYVGSETGYTSGNWYYYDGTDWVSGGVYNSTALSTDTTLSISGKAADAKITGDKVTELSSAVDFLANNDQDLLIFNKDSVSSTRAKTFTVTIPAGTYTLTVGNVTSSDTAYTSSRITFFTPNGNKSVDVPRGSAHETEITLAGDTTQVAFYGAHNYSDSNGVTFAYTSVKLFSATQLHSTLDSLNSRVTAVEAYDTEVQSYIDTMDVLEYNGTVSGTNFKTVEVDLPAGDYYINIGGIASSDTDVSKSRMRFYHDGTGLFSIDLDRAAITGKKVTFEQRVTTIDFYAATTTTTGSGDTFTYTGVEIYRITPLSKWIYDNQKNIDNINVYGNVFRFDKYFSHIGVDKGRNDTIIIPCQSLADVSKERRLGFKVMEINVRQTSDGKYVCLHGVDGAFGGQFTDLQGESVYTTLVSSMTLADIQSNIRYRSKYAKYRTAPCTLQEILYECKKQGIIPLVEYHSTYTDEIEILDAIMGRNNYILGIYSADREDASNAMLGAFLSITDATSLVEKCETSGGFYVAGINATSSVYDGFEDSDWVELVDAVHAAGYLIAFNGGYTGEVLSQKLFSLGFDYSGSGWNINEITHGNICNLFGDVDFSDFVTTGTVADEVLNLAADDTVLTSVTNSVFLGGGSLHIRFNGTIHLKFGDYIDTDFTSDGFEEMWFSTYFEEAVPTFTITAITACEVFEINYKASKM